MSQYYQMDVCIKGYNPARERDVIVAGTFYPVDDDYYAAPDHSELTSSGRGSICGGEEAWAEGFAKDIMRANGGPCEVYVQATYLEELPCEYYSFDKDDYERLMKEGE